MSRRWVSTSLALFTCLAAACGHEGTEGEVHEIAVDVAPSATADAGAGDGSDAANTGHHLDEVGVAPAPEGGTAAGCLAGAHALEAIEGRWHTRLTLDPAPGLPRLGVDFADIACHDLRYALPSADAIFTAPTSGPYRMIARADAAVRFATRRCAPADAPLVCGGVDAAVIDLEEGETVAIIAAAEQEVPVEVVVQRGPLASIDPGKLTLYHHPESAEAGLVAQGAYDLGLVPPTLRLRFFTEGGRLVDETILRGLAAPVDRTHPLRGRFRIEATITDEAFRAMAARGVASIRGAVQDIDARWVEWNAPVEATLRERARLPRGAACTPGALHEACAPGLVCDPTARCAHQPGVLDADVWLTVIGEPEGADRWVDVRIDDPPSAVSEMRFYSPEIPRVGLMRGEAPVDGDHAVRVGPDAWFEPAPTDIPRVWQVEPADRPTYAPGFLGARVHDGQSMWAFGRLQLGDSGAECAAYAAEAAPLCLASPYTVDEDCTTARFAADCARVAEAVTAEALPRLADAPLHLQVTFSGGGSLLRSSAAIGSREAAGRFCGRSGLAPCPNGDACQVFAGRSPWCAPLAEACPAEWALVELDRYEISPSTWAWHDDGVGPRYEAGGGSCADGGLARIFRFTASEADDFHAIVSDYAGDPLLYARSHCPTLAQRFEQACHDDFLAPVMPNPGIEFSLDAGQSIYLFVADKGTGPEAGEPHPRFGLRVGRGPLPADFGQPPAELD